MWVAGLPIVFRRYLPRCTTVESTSLVGVNSSVVGIGKLTRKPLCHSVHSTVVAVNDDNTNEQGKMALAKNLACLLEESSNLEERKPKTRMELKRFFELRIKKRVKEQYINDIGAGFINSDCKFL